MFDFAVLLNQVMAHFQLCPRGRGYLSARAVPLLAVYSGSRRETQWFRAPQHKVTTTLLNLQLSIPRGATQRRTVCIVLPTLESLCLFPMVAFRVRMRAHVDSLPSTLSSLCSDSERYGRRRRERHQSTVTRWREHMVSPVAVAATSLE